MAGEDKEVSIVTNRTIGFAFSLSVEKEKRIATEAKYPDKIVSTARLSGHADSWDETILQFKEAKKEIDAILGEKEESEATICLSPDCENPATWESLEGASWCDVHVPRDDQKNVLEPFHPFPQHQETK